MNIAVATRFQVFVVDDQGEYVGDILPPEYGFHHYGVTWNEDFMFVYVWGGGHWIEVLDHNLKSVDRLLGPPIRIDDTHQIAWSREQERLWVCHTSWERFLITTPKRDADPLIWTPLPGRGRDRPSGPHLNSVWFDGEGHVALVASNWGEGDADIHIFDLETYNMVETAPGAHRAHSVYRHYGEYLTLGIGEVKWGGVLYRLPECEVMKGIVYANGRMLFGVQQDIPARKTRRVARAGWLCEVNPETMEVLNMINFGRGQVNEIRALDAEDAAHHNLPWTGRYGA